MHLYDESSHCSECDDRGSTAVDDSDSSGPIQVESTTKVTEAYVVECGACSTVQVRVSTVYSAILRPMLLDELLTCSRGLS